jgi:hypothetical protein
LKLGRFTLPGTHIAQVNGMGFITMWISGDRRCVLVVGGEQMILRIVDATSILREEIVRSDTAALVANRWEQEQDHAPLRVAEAAPDLAGQHHVGG